MTLFVGVQVTERHSPWVHVFNSDACGLLKVSAVSSGSKMYIQLPDSLPVTSSSTAISARTMMKSVWTWMARNEPWTDAKSRLGRLHLRTWASTGTKALLVPRATLGEHLIRCLLMILGVSSDRMFYYTRLHIPLCEQDWKAPSLIPSLSFDDTSLLSYAYLH